LLSLISLSLLNGSPLQSLARNHENTNNLKSSQETSIGAPTVSETKIGAKTYATGSILVKARRERIWEILTDYENAPELFQDVKKCHVLEDYGAKKLVRQVVMPKGSPMHFDYTIEVSENAPELMQWHRTSGALKDVSGSWKLEPDSTHRNTIITYSIYIDGGIFLPAWLLRGQSKNLLPDVLRSVKEAAERSEANAGTASSGKG
jgi:uncharacterized membrane protein